MKKKVHIIALTCILMSIGIPASAQHEYVDLGLSVKWATCNVGAEKPTDKGDLFAWGETEPKSEYTMSNYKFSINGSYDDFTKYNYKDRKTTVQITALGVSQNSHLRFIMKMRL